MSLMPLLFSSWWEDLDKPHHVFDQHFGLPIDPTDLAERILHQAPSRSELVLFKPRSGSSSRYHPFLQSLAKRGNRGVSTVNPDKDKFNIQLDVNQFSPDEISVKIADDKYIQVDAKHEEKEDEHGWISRQFTRKYLVPQQCDIEQIESRLSSDGVLTISVPKKQLTKPDSNEKVIKVQYTGQPAITEKAPQSTANKNQEQEPQQAAQQRGRKSTVKAA